MGLNNYYWKPGEKSRINVGAKAMTGDRVRTGGGDYRKIDTGGGRYVETRGGTYYERYNNQPQSLADAAAEIQKLLKQLEQSYPTSTTTEQMVVATKAIERMESDPTLKQRVISAAKEGGLAAFEKALDNPLGALITGAIKGWLETEAK